MRAASRTRLNFPHLPLLFLGPVLAWAPVLAPTAWAADGDAPEGKILPFRGPLQPRTQAPVFATPDLARLDYELRRPDARAQLVAMDELKRLASEQPSPELAHLIASYFLDPSHRERASAGIRLLLKLPPRTVPPEILPQVAKALESGFELDMMPEISALSKESPLIHAALPELEQARKDPGALIRLLASAAEKPAAANVLLFELENKTLRLPPRYRAQLSHALAVALQDARTDTATQVSVAYRMTRAGRELELGGEDWSEALIRTLRRVRHARGGRGEEVPLAVANALAAAHQQSPLTDEQLRRIESYLQEDGLEFTRVHFLSQVASVPAGQHLLVAYLDELSKHPGTDFEKLARQKAIAWEALGRSGVASEELRASLRTRLIQGDLRAAIVNAPNLVAELRPVFPPESLAPGFSLDAAVEQRAAALNPKKVTLEEWVAGIGQAPAPPTAAEIALKKKVREELQAALRPSFTDAVTAVLHGPPPRSEAEIGRLFAALQIHEALGLRTDVARAEKLVDLLGGSLPPHARTAVLRVLSGAPELPVPLRARLIELAHEPGTSELIDKLPEDLHRALRRHTSAIDSKGCFRTWSERLLLDLAAPNRARPGAGGK